MRIRNLSLIIFTGFMLFFLSPSVSAQVKVTNQDGDKIILMPDGTWRYADTTTVSTDKKSSTKKQPTKKEKQPKATKKKNQPKVKLTKAEKRRLKALEQQQKAQKRLDAVQNKTAQKRVKKQTKDTSKPPKTKTSKVKDTTKKQPKAKTPKAKTPKVKTKKQPKTKAPKAPKAKKNNKKQEVKKGKDNTKRGSENTIKGSTTTSKPATKTKETKTSAKQLKAIKLGFKPFKERNPVVIPEDECSYSLNEVDPFTEKRKIATSNSFFFGYTHPELMKYMAGNHYLTCTGHIANINGYLVLNLKFLIDSPYAQKEYGGIEEGSQLLIKLINGKTVTLYSEEADGGIINRTEGKTAFATSFIIDAKSEKLLRKSEINQIRMSWSKGYEDYEIYEIDYLMMQFKCIDNAPKIK